MRRVSALLSFAFVVAGVLPASASGPQGRPDPPPPFNRLLGIGAVPAARIVQVEPGSAAEGAGLGIGDLVVSLNGKDLRHYQDLQSFVFAIRESAMLSRAEPDVWKYEATGEVYSARRTEVRIPARLGELVGFTSTFGVVVMQVPKDSAAERAGLRPWDFIEKINGESVPNMRHLLEVDQRLSEAAARDGRVRLTLTRWKPRPTPSGYEFVGHATREVTLPLSQPGRSEE